RDINAAANAFASLPPSLKQTGDSAEIVGRASQQAAAAADSAAQSVAAAQPQAQQVLASLRSAATTLANLQHGAAHLAHKLRDLGEVTGRANLLALNAGLELARAGQSALQATADWQRLAAQQVRQLAASAEQIGKLAATLRSGAPANAASNATAAVATKVQ